MGFSRLLNVTQNINRPFKKLVVGPEKPSLVSPIVGLTDLFTVKKISPQ